MTLKEGLTWLVKHHVYGALEVKGTGWATNPRWFELLHEQCRRTGHPAVVKRLANLRMTAKIVENAHAANVQIAAIYGPGVHPRASRVARTAAFAKRGVKFDATW
jgi:hypothetical protein